MTQVSIYIGCYVLEHKQVKGATSVALFLWGCKFKMTILLSRFLKVSRYTWRVSRGKRPKGAIRRRATLDAHQHPNTFPKGEQQKAVSLCLTASVIGLGGLPSARTLFPKGAKETPRRAHGFTEV